MGKALSFIDTKVLFVYNHVLKQMRLFARTRMMRIYLKRKERKSRDDCKKAESSNIEKPVIENGIKHATTPRTKPKRNEGKEKKDKTSTS